MTCKTCNEIARKYRGKRLRDMDTDDYDFMMENCWDSVTNKLLVDKECFKELLKEDISECEEDAREIKNHMKQLEDENSALERQTIIDALKRITDHSDITVDQMLKRMADGRIKE